MNIENIKVSVVVPVYNAEKYLAEAIDSILSQTHRNIELILVDDGSKDTSLKIMSDYQKKDARVQVFCQKNLYAGVARNFGISKANGEYIIFLDSDDVFEKNMLHDLLKSTLKYNCELIFFGYWTFKNNKLFRRKISNRYVSNETISPSEIAENVFQVCDGVPWNKLINLSFLKKLELKYQEISSYNDEYFNRIILLLANKVVFLNKRYVNYRIGNTNSIQGNKNKKMSNSVRVIEKIYLEMKERDLLQLYGESFCKYVVNSICYNVLNVSTYNNITEFFDYLFDERVLFFLNNINISCITNSTIDEKEYLELFKLILTGDKFLTLSKVCEYQNETMISKKSKEYRLGRKIFSLIKV